VVDGVDINADIHAVLDHIKDLTDTVRSDEWLHRQTDHGHRQHPGIGGSTG
jgi:hypothetical protein